MCTDWYESIRAAMRAEPTLLFLSPLTTHPFPNVGGGTFFGLRE